MHPVARDLIVTAAASFASFVAGLALIFIFGRLLGGVLLGEYLLVRRVAAWLQPAVHLGLGVALPRYVAYSTNKSPDSQLDYFVSGVTCIGSFGAIVGAVLWLARHPLGVLFFGDAQFSRLMLPLFLLTFGGAFQVAVYGFYRGRLKMRLAGALQFCVAIVPIMAAVSLFRTRSVVLIVSAIGASVLVISAVFAVPIIRQLHRTSIRNLTARGLELLKYGVSRVPGDLSIGALLAIGPVFVSHYMPVSRVSSLLVAISMLTAASVSTEPLGIVFLSKISMMLSDSRLSDVQTYLSHLMSATIEMSLFLAIQLVVFADVLLNAWIGPSVLEGIWTVRVVLVGVPFYLFFTALRSTVDAGSVRPLNARNVMVALVALLIMIILSVSLAPQEFLLRAVAISLVLSLALLAYGTKMALTKLYAVRMHWKESALPICSALILGTIGLAYHRTSGCSLQRVAVLELFFGLAFLAACFCSGARWVQFLYVLAFRQTSGLESAGH